jgi:hypothetical protein
MYDLKILSKFGLFLISKAFYNLPFSFPTSICNHPKLISFGIETLIALKKGLETLVDYFF